MKAKLTYFKESGKYYTDAETEVYGNDFWDGVVAVRRLREQRCLPGLASGQWDNSILIVFECSSVPQLLPAVKS